MEVLFILLPATLLIAGMFVGLFIFSVNKGQFEELESPANRAIFEDVEFKDVEFKEIEKTKIKTKNDLELKAKSGKGKKHGSN